MFTARAQQPAPTGFVLVVGGAPAGAAAGVVTVRRRRFAEWLRGEVRVTTQQCGATTQFKTRALAAARACMHAHHMHMHVYMHTYTFIRVYTGGAERRCNSARMCEPPRMTRWTWYF